MNNQLLSLGILVIFIGFALVFIGALSSAKKGDAKVAIGGFVGFIPFGFANDKNMVWVLTAMMIIALFFFIILPYLWK